MSFIEKKLQKNFVCGKRYKKVASFLKSWQPFYIHSCL